MRVGSIVHVRSFSEYAARVPLEEGDGYVPASRVPAGTFVAVQSSHGTVVGLVTGIQHAIREEFLPFLSGEKQEFFTPYANDYRTSYMAIYGIGSIRGNEIRHSLDAAPLVNDPVELMETAEIRKFHTPDGKPSVSYYRRIYPKVDADALCGALDQVALAVPESRQMLAALKKHAENRP